MLINKLNTRAVWKVTSFLCSKRRNEYRRIACVVTCLRPAVLVSRLCYRLLPVIAFQNEHYNRKPRKMESECCDKISDGNKFVSCRYLL